MSHSFDLEDGWCHTHRRYCDMGTLAFFPEPHDKPAPRSDVGSPANQYGPYAYIDQDS